jgi:glycosyltransferase involved in cell wall biosynthesis/Ser/Thr protein kinase RdoA (MazF antagonist)
MDDVRSQPIAYIMSRFPKLTETFILREMLELEKQGESLLVFPLLHSNESLVHEELKNLKAKVTFTSFLSLAILSANFYFLKRSPRQYFKILGSVLKENLGSWNLFMGAIGIFPKSVYYAKRMEQEGVGHIHAHYATHPALSAFIIHELTSIPFSFTAHAHDIFIRDRLKMLETKIKKAEFVVTVSHYNKQYLRKLYPDIPEGKIHVIRCGIDPQSFQKKEHSKKSKALTILSIGSLQPYKGQKHLINACAILKRKMEKDFQCLIIGEGKERKELEHMIESRGLFNKVKLLGGQSQEKVKEFLSRADIFVLPSVVAPNGQVEGLPVVLMESMASGLPVVVSDLTGVPELVENNTSGLLVTPSDEIQLADAIIRLAEDELLRKTLGQNAKKKVAQDFQIDENVSQLRKCIHHEPEQNLIQIKKWAQDVLGKIPQIPASCQISPLHLRSLPKGHDSETYEIILKSDKGNASKFILKIHKPHKGSFKEKAKKEFEALSYLREEFTRISNWLVVPQPVDYLSESGAILMEKCEGTRLDRLLRFMRFSSSDSKQEKLFHYLRSAGEWLQCFQGITKKEGDNTPVYQRIESDFLREVDTCCQLGLKEHIADRLRSYFLQTKEKLFKGKHRIVGFHCDFGPYNVFVNERKLTVIDFEGLQDGLAFEDAGHFLAVLESMPAYHLGQKLYSKAKAAFLEGYSPDRRVDEEALGFFTLLQMVKIMAYNPDFKRAIKGKIRLKFFSQWFQQECRQL